MARKLTSGQTKNRRMIQITGYNDEDTFISIFSGKRCAARLGDPGEWRGMMHYEAPRHESIKRVVDQIENGAWYLRAFNVGRTGGLSVQFCNREEQTAENSPAVLGKATIPHVQARYEELRTACRARGEAIPADLLDDAINDVIGGWRTPPAEEQGKLVIDLDAPLVEVDLKNDSDLPDPQTDAPNVDQENDPGLYRLIGRRIIDVGALPDALINAYGWNYSYPSDCICMLLDNGILLFPSADEEGNNPGAQFGLLPNGQDLFVGVDRDKNPVVIVSG